MMMNKRKLYRKYERIKSLDQLQTERRRIDSMIEVKELELRYDYLSVKESLSVTNVVSATLSRFSNVGPVIESAIDGFMLVLSLFKKRKRRD